MTFKDNNTFEKRVQLSKKIKEKYPDRIPIIIQASKDIELKREKFLSPTDITVGGFLFELRKTLHIHHTQALFLYTDNLLLVTSSAIEVIYNKHKSDDGFLYITVAKERTFGEDQLCNRSSF